MTKLVLALCGENGVDAEGHDIFKIHRYAYVDAPEGDERIRDIQYAEKIAAKLGIRAENNAWEAIPPPQTVRRFFDVYLTVQNHDRANASYKIDYRRYNECPSEITDDGMAIYAIVKREGVRPVMERVREKQQEKKRKVEVKQQAPKDDGSAFLVGCVYEFEFQDSLGHVVKDMVKVVGLMPSDKKIVFTVGHSSKPIVGIIDKSEDGTHEFIRHKRLQGVVSSLRKVA